MSAQETARTGGTAPPQAASVDVLMLAYNVAPFISRAIEGVLAQRTGFPVRLVIAEDGSTDGTRAICERWAQEHPSRITYHPGSSNIGIAARTVEALGRCTAKYVAICDSDDYWTDSSKLTAQIGFLEAHPDHGFSYTDVSVISRDGREKTDDGYDGVRAAYAAGHLFVKLLQGNFINNSTTVARRDLLLALRPNACRDELIGDHIRWLQLSMRTKAHFLSPRTTAYRAGGITSGNVEARNRGVMLSLLGGLLLEYHRIGLRPGLRERKILARKMIGVLVRPGTPARVKPALLLALFRYLPAMFQRDPAKAPLRGEHRAA